MEYKQLTKEEVDAIKIGTKVNFGNGDIREVLGFSDGRPYKTWENGSSVEKITRMVTTRNKNGEERTYDSRVLSRATVETLDETIKRCNYCGKLRPANEIKPGTIRRNRQWETNLYCADDHCCGYDQMGAEG